MALKASVTFGAKRSHDYNSDSYTVSLEAEIADPTRAQEAIAGLFDEAREAVALQIEEARSGNVATRNTGNVASTRNGSSNDSNGENGPGNGNGKPVTEKQVVFISKLAKLKNIKIEDVLQQAGVDDINDLTAKEASELIDNLKKERRHANVSNRISNSK